MVFFCHLNKAYIAYVVKHAIYNLDASWDRLFTSKIRSIIKTKLRRDCLIFTRFDMGLTRLNYDHRLSGSSFQSRPEDS